MINLKEIVTKTRLTFVLGLIATTVVGKFNTAMAAIAALTASSIGFTGTGAEGNGFASTSNNVEKALIALGRAELSHIIADGKPETLNCSFCNTNYTFTVDEMKEILAKCTH